MLTLCVIGIIVLGFNLLSLAFKATWGIMKAILFVMFLPATFFIMLAAGLASLVFPAVIIGLIASFILPRIGN
ncbi:MAG: hypothetical protein Q4E84_04090 [Clostridia bacterium]|nr:hypothetical protein [Clostridia bacterium]MDO5303067.1 hypothetical protein [Clostridia bacterium]